MTDGAGRRVRSSMTALVNVCGCMGASGSSSDGVGGLVPV